MLHSKNCLLAMICINFLVTEAIAQKQALEKTDFLFSVSKTAKADTSKVNALNAIAEEYRTNNPDTAIYFADEAMALATKLNYKMGIADAYIWKGTAITNLGKYEEALKYLNEGLLLNDKVLATEKTVDKFIILKQRGRAYNNIGTVYDNQGNYPEALKNYSASLKILEEIGDKKGIAKACNNLGLFYYQKSDFPKSLDCFFKSLKVREEIRVEYSNDTTNKRGMASSYNNIGLIYKTQLDYPKALEYYFKSLKIFEEVGDNKGMALSLSNIGNSYYHQSNYFKSLDYNFKSLKILKELEGEHPHNSYYTKGMTGVCYNNIGDAYTGIYINDKTGTAHFFLDEKKEKSITKAALLDSAFVLQNKAHAIRKERGDKLDMTYSLSGIARVYFLWGKYKEALKEYQEAYSIADNIGAINEKKMAAQRISDCYKKLKEYDNALQWYEIYITHKDTVFNKEKVKELTMKAMNYEFEIKEAATKSDNEKRAAIAAAENKKQKMMRNGFMGGFAIVLLFSMVVVNQKKRISKEKSRSEDLLLNILPAETAEELKKHGFTKAKDFDEVTVLFTDFKNFTLMSEKLSAQELVNEINYCYSAFDHIITEHGIEKIKTIGDSYMCAGGLPLANKTNAEETVKAALEIRDFMETEKQKRLADGKPFFEIRIGCNTGPVVAGIVGIKKFAYDIWGETVNIASRMESSGEAGKVNISGSTYELVKNKFNCTHRGKIEAKNKGLIDMYFVER